MDYRKRLFTRQNLYDVEHTDDLFLNAIKKNIAFHEANCSQYAQILRYKGFHINCLQSITDLYRIPVIPTLFYKSHELYSIPKDRLMIQVTSSGTKGKQSHIGFDRNTLYYALRMVLKTFSYYHLISAVPTNYIVLGYQPSKHNQMGAAKTAFGTTLLAPALHREYALKNTGTGYELNLEGIKSTLIRYSKMKFPVRFMGFPAYLYFLVKDLKESNIQLQLPKNSKVFLAGGWKQFFTEKVDKNELYQLIEETLGVKEENCKEFFGAVEHPIVYCDCKNHHFHVPVYSRVIIRDVNTLLPVENGKVGLLSLATPLVESVPLVSVMTDDLAVMYDGKTCGCGITSPYFEVIGRVGLQNIKTCAAGASELLEGIKL
jgi:phenylacetate-coenzyme A ligase PaaK-like adenylate-forming protein